jgi:Type II secretion system (T2SS), protein M subtype b
MTLRPRDRRALAWLGVSLLLGLIYQAWSQSSSASAAPAPADSVPGVEQLLARLRDTAATVPAKQDILKKVSADLAGREKGLIKAASTQQAQAQLVTLLRGLANAETPPVEIRAAEFGPVGLIEDSYGTVSVSIQTTCRIEQLLNLLASIAASGPEMMVLRDLRITSASPKDKTIGVRLTVTGVVDKSLVPAKKGATP